MSWYMPWCIETIGEVHGRTASKEGEGEWDRLMLRKASAHAQTFSQQVNSTMAARGHVQDPNDRRLRPIYGEDSMGSCTVLHVWVFVKGPFGLTVFTLFKVRGVKSRGGNDAAPPPPTTVSAARSAQWQCTLPGLSRRPGRTRQPRLTAHSLCVPLSYV